MPYWLEKAYTYLGLAEVKGPKHNPKIVEMWKRIRAPFTDDETPWCAALVGGVLEECGIRSTRSAAARSYLKWGIPLSGAARGAVVVFWRKSPTGPYGHVAFVVGKDAYGNIMVIGGNQGDRVSIAAFDPVRIIGYRWPEGEPLPAAGWATLPVVNSTGEVSTNEA